MKLLMLLAFLIALQGCINSEDKSTEYLASGKSYFQKGNYDKARNEFKNALYLNDQLADAYFHLALIDEKNQNWLGMFQNLTKAVEFDSKNKEAFLKLGHLALLSGHIDEVLTHIETLLKKNADNPDVLALKGALLVKQGNFDGASQLAEHILKNDPQNADGISLKTAIYMAKNDLPLALETVNEGLKAKPSDDTLLLLKLQINQQQKNITAVEQDYLDLIHQYPDKLDYSYGLAKHYFENNERDKAASTLKQLIEKHPDKIQPKLALVEYQLKINPDIAEKTLATYLAQQPNEPKLLFLQASWYFKQNKLPETKQTLIKVAELVPGSQESLSAKILLAKVALQENDIETASKIIGEVLSLDENNFEGLLIKAGINLKQGFYDAAITHLNKVLKQKPNSAEALVMIGQAYLNNDAPELAEESFRKVLANNPANFDALLPVIANLIKKKEAKKADELLIKALKIIPDHLGALQALAQVRILQKDWIGAQKVANAIATKPDGLGFSKFLSGRISEEQGYFKEATGQYKEALVFSPDLLDALRSMARSYEALRQTDDMYAFLVEFIKAHPDKPFPWLLKGQLLLKDNRVSDAIDLLTDAIDRWPKISEFYETLSNCYLVTQDVDAAITILQKGLVAIPDNFRLSIMLASIWQQTGQYKQALGVYENLTVKYPPIDHVVNNLASLLLDHFNTPDNVTRALSLAQRFEHADQPVFVDTYAWALINNGKSEESLKLLRNIVKRMPDIPEFRYHLGTAYYKTNSKALAVEELEKALELGEKKGKFNEKEATLKLLKQIKNET